LRGFPVCVLLFRSHPVRASVVAMNPIWLSIFLIFFQEPVADPPAPTLVSVEPAPVVQGTTVAITFRGTGFVARQTLPEMPAGIDVGIAGPTEYTDENTMTVFWHVSAPAGRFYVEVMTSPPYNSETKQPPAIHDTSLGDSQCSRI